MSHFRVTVVLALALSLQISVECFRIRTKKNSGKLAATGQCTSADQSIIDSMGPGNEAGSWAMFVKECTGKSVRIFPPRWLGHSGMVTCMKEQQVSNGCATCFADMSKYGFDNCKTACMWSWCSAGCLQCTGGNKEANKKLRECTGMEDIPQPEQCSGAASGQEKEVNAGQCTAADQSIMKSMGPGNEAGSWPMFVKECTGKSVRIFPPKWTGHSGMVTCMQEQQVSNGCSTCFADMSKYGFDNCKTACMWSWCSAGCLQCTGGNKEANKKLQECTGMLDVPQPAQCSGAFVNELEEIQAKWHRLWQSS